MDHPTEFVEGGAGEVEVEGSGQSVDTLTTDY